MALRDRLSAARHARFVGREAERSRFEAALRAESLPFHVLHVHGPGGIGKTTLLNAFRRLCQEAGVPAAYLDARDLDPTPEAFEQAAEAAFRTAELGGDGAAPLSAASPERRVLLVDTYEAVDGLDGWLRRSFLPELDEGCLVVLAGRNRPDLAWQTDLGWQAEVEVLPLRNLTAAESEALLTARGVPAEQHAAVFAFTHGHPMALALVAEHCRRHPDVAFEPADSPDVVRALLQQFLDDVPTPAHRAALDASALVRALTEPFLAALLDEGEGEVQALFAWLRRLPFVEEGPHGVFPHDLARGVLAADLRWRDPERYAALHARARRYYTAQLRAARRQRERRDVLAAYVYLYRDNPVVQPFFRQLRAQWRQAGRQTVGALQPEDEPALREMVARHEGEEAAAHAAAWFQRQPDAVEVYRDPDGRPTGFLMALALEATTEEARAADPATAAAWAFLRERAPLRADERALLFRFWMDAEAYQGVSAVQSLVFADTVRHYLTTPHLAFSLLPCAEPDFWAGVFAFAGLRRYPGADFEVGGRRYGVYGHDWRATPPDVWLERLAERVPHVAPADGPAAAPDPLVVLSEPDFAEAVREALRYFARPYKLSGNPLLHGRLVAERAGAEAEEPERIEALCALLREAAETLEDAPREAHFYHALRVTYLQPARTQALAAERLDLPFSTYRRHLKRGVEHVAEVLWRQETAV